MHPNNIHNKRYNFETLIAASPQLKPFVAPNKYGDLSVNFFNPEAVKALNTALLKTHYNINWTLAPQYLCPPIPGRADYIHYLNDLLQHNNCKTPITGLDIGTGANVIYPLLGHRIYNWQFIATDIDAEAITHARHITEINKLQHNITLRMQQNKSHKIKGILKPNDTITFVMCNPPFHSSEADAKAATLRKLKNLKRKNNPKTVLNFSGQHHELWCKGGELRFVTDLIFESRNFATQCQWFTSLISQQKHLKPLYNTLQKVDAKRVETITMGQGQKVSRFIAWTFQQ